MLRTKELGGTRGLCPLQKIQKPAGSSCSLAHCSSFQPAGERPAGCSLWKRVNFPRTPINATWHLRRTYDFRSLQSYATDTWMPHSKILRESQRIMAPPPSRVRRSVFACHSFQLSEGTFLPVLPVLLVLLFPLCRLAGRGPTCCNSYAPFECSSPPLLEPNEPPNLLRPSRGALPSAPWVLDRSGDHPQLGLIGASSTFKRQTTDWFAYTVATWADPPAEADASKPPRAGLPM